MSWEEWGCSRPQLQAAVCMWPADKQCAVHSSVNPSTCAGARAAGRRQCDGPKQARFRSADVMRKAVGKKKSDSVQTTGPLFWVNYGQLSDRTRCGYISHAANSVWGLVHSC